MNEHTASQIRRHARQDTPTMRARSRLNQHNPATTVSQNNRIAPLYVVAFVVALLPGLIGCGGPAARRVTPSAADKPANPTAALAQSTVTLLAVEEYFDGEITRSSEGGGSGFVVQVGRERAIATAAHVLGHASSVEVFHPSGFRTFVTHVLARDDRADVAIVRVASLPAQARPVALGDDEPKLADDVVLISSPLGLDTTVAFGTVSAFRPQWQAFQLAAGVSPGSSGGLAATRDGRVLGVIRSKASSSRDGENITLITPARHIHRLLRHIKETPLALPPRFDAMVDDFEGDVEMVKSARVKGRLAAGTIDFRAGDSGLQHYCAYADDPSADVALGLGGDIEHSQWSVGRGFSCASYAPDSPVRILIANDHIGDTVNVRVKTQK